MRKEEVQKLKHGLYRLKWKEGGNSLACVGSFYSGQLWYACSNWTCPDGDNGIICTDWKKVKSVKRFHHEQ